MRLTAIAAAAALASAVVLEAAPILGTMQQNPLQKITADFEGLTDQHDEAQLVARFNPTEAGSSVVHGSSSSDVVGHAIDEAVSHSASPLPSSSKPSQTSSTSEGFFSKLLRGLRRPKKRGNGDSDAERSSASDRQPIAAPSPWPSSSDAVPTHRGTVPYIVEANRVQGAGDPRNRVIVTYHDSLNPFGREGDVIHGWTQRRHLREFDQEVIPRYLRERPDATRVEHLQYVRKHGDPWQRFISLDLPAEDRYSFSRREALSQLTPVRQAYTDWDEANKAVQQEETRWPRDAAALETARQTERTLKARLDKWERWALRRYPQTDPPPHVPAAPPGFTLPPPVPRPTHWLWSWGSSKGYPVHPGGPPISEEHPAEGMPYDPAFAVAGMPVRVKTARGWGYVKETDRWLNLPDWIKRLLGGPLRYPEIPRESPPATPPSSPTPSFHSASSHSPSASPFFTPPGSPVHREDSAARHS